MVQDAEKLFTAHGVPFNTEGWMYIAKDLKGKLPLKIRAVPEGALVPTHNVLFTVENTDSKCFWLNIICRKRTCTLLVPHNRF